MTTVTSEGETTTEITQNHHQNGEFGSENGADRFPPQNRIRIGEFGPEGVDGLRLSTPTNPQGAPPLGWRHDGVVCVVLEFQSGNAILAQVQGTCLG